MKSLRKTLNTLLAAVMLFTALAQCGIFVPAQSAPGVFLRLDKLRESFLRGEGDPFPSAANTAGSVLAFKKGVSETLALSMLQKLGPYRPLAYTSQLVFAVPAPVGTVRAVCGDALAYCVEDGYSDISLCGETDGIPYELTAINSDPADRGGAGVTIAVLDSGIDRSLPCFENADILPGWDAVLGEDAVTADDAGHGTMVCGIICAKGYGVAQGATVLPVRITDDGRRIRTSALVESLYYAADSGADVINMSFGGYIENAAESEAIEYAVETGCVLVASAGNEGADPEYGGHYSYPASFQGVVSVAAFGKDGKVCAFSQHNDMVDTCAPGEELSLYAPAEGGQTVLSINGTSFSTAYVSAAAALCVEKRGEKISSALFEKLLEYASDSARDDRAGWGALNIEKLLACAQMPFVEGIRRNEVYYTEVSAVFADAEAVLDGEPYESGDPVFSQGKHTLTVTGERGGVTFEFTVDTLPLTYETEKGEGWLAFTFDRGTAQLDGKRYRSGTHITREGEHEFVLTGPYGNTVGTAFTISRALPAVTGVVENGVYNEALEIVTVGTGRTYLDGEEFTGSAFVSENGEHILRVTDITGELVREYPFTVRDLPARQTGELPGNCAYFDPEYGCVACWDAGGSVISLYTPEDLTTVMRTVELPGQALCVYAENRKVYLIHTRGWQVYSREDLLFGETPAEEYAAEEDFLVSACVFDGRVIYSDEEGVVHIGADDPSPLDLGSRSTLVSAVTRCVYAYSAYTPSKIYENSGSGWSEHSLDSEPEYFGLVASDRCVCVGGDIYTDGFGKLRCRLPDGEKALYCAGDRVITAGSVYSADDGIRRGSYEELVSSVCPAGEKLALIQSDGVFRMVAARGLCGAARAVTPFAGEPVRTDDFTLKAELGENASVSGAIYDPYTDSVLVITKNENLLYSLDPVTGELKKAVSLRYTPSKLVPAGESAAVIFDKCRAVYFVKEKDYVFFPGEIGGLCYCGGELYAVSGGALCVCAGDPLTAYPVEGFENVKSVAEYGGALCVLGEDAVTLYSPGENVVLASVPTAFRSSYLVGGGYVFIGADSFFGTALEPASSLDEAPFCVSGGAAFCESGVYRVSDGKRVSSVPVRGELGLVTPQYRLFAFSQNSYTVTDCMCDLSSGAIIEGVEDGGEYAGDVTINAHPGTVYLDGEPVEAPFTVSAAGKHTVRAVLPFGISRTVTFTLSKSAESISLSAEKLKLSVGQSVTLRASLLPAKATGKIVFSCQSPCVSVTPEGRVTAISDGMAYVVASVEGTGIFAVCTVDVTETNIVFKTAGYTIDRDSGTVLGVKPGTALIDIISDIVPGGSVGVVDPNGDPVTANSAGTGMALIKKDDTGEITDSLTLSVTGDPDGDGAVTSADVDMLFSHLRGSKILAGAAAASLDVNGNGKVTSADLKEMYKLLEFGGGEASKLSLKVRAPDFVCEGGLLPLEIIPEKLGSVSVAGVVRFEEGCGAFVKVDSPLSEIYTDNIDGGLRFCIPAAGRKKGASTAFYVKVASGAETITLSLSDLTAGSAEGLFALPDITLTLPVAKPANKLSVVLPDSDLEFDPSVKAYDVTVPYGETSFSPVIACERDCYAYLSQKALAEEGVTEITLVYKSPAETSEYVFRVKHGELLSPDTDSSLGGISVVGASLEPAFSPDITSYTVTLPENGSVSVTAHAAGKRAKVDSRTEYGENYLRYVFTCTAEDGSSTVYTVDVIRRGETVSAETSEESDVPSQTEPSSPEESAFVSTPEESVPEESVSPSAEESMREGSSSEPVSRVKEKDGAALLPYVVGAAFAVTAAAVLAIFLRRRKRT